MGCYNLLNYVIILLKEKKRKEIRKKNTRTPHLFTYVCCPPSWPCCWLLPHACATVYMHCERRYGAAARAHHRLAALLPSACMRPVYLSEREPRAIRACAAAAVRTRVLPLCRPLKHVVLSTRKQTGAHAALSTRKPVNQRTRRNLL
jgi:hypothetical protein